MPNTTICAPPYLLKPLFVKSETRPILSPLPNGAYGMPSSCSGTVVGPHPSGLASTSGTLKPGIWRHAAMAEGLPVPARPVTSGAA